MFPSLLTGDTVLAVVELALTAAATQSCSQDQQRQTEPPTSREENTQVSGRGVHEIAFGRMQNKQEENMAKL